MEDGNRVDVVSNEDKPRKASSVSQKKVAGTGAGGGNNTKDNGKAMGNKGKGPLAEVVSKQRTSQSQNQQQNQLTKGSTVASAASGGGRGSREQEGEEVEEIQEN